MRSPFFVTLAAVLILVAFIMSSFTTKPHPIISNPESYAEPCPLDTAVSGFIFAEDITYKVAREILSAETLLQNANVSYLSGSGTILSFGMTGSLTGPSAGFQVYPGSTLTVAIEENCP